MFLGKAAAIAVQLLVLEVVLGAGVALLYDVELRSLGLLVAAAVAATAGLAATGTLYGVLAAGLRVRETLVPLLLLPVVAPVMLGRDPGLGGGARQRQRRGVAVGRAAGAVRGAVHVDRDAGLRAAPGGVMRRADSRC